jgi:hypothetical protein
MAYFIFGKDLNDVENTIYKIAENQSDLDNLNLEKNSYKVIEDLQINFNNVKYGIKLPLKYNNDTITYVDQLSSFKDKTNLSLFINNNKNQIKQFLDNNSNHPLFNRWNSYYIQLNNLNLDNILYPLNKSLEQYFTDLGQPSFNILQLP